MASHFWVLPWLALAAGLAAAAAGLFPLPSVPPPRDVRAPGRFPALLIVLWLVIIGAGAILLQRCGQDTGIPFVAARGVLFGAVTGLLLVLGARPVASTRASLYRAPFLFGLPTAVVAAARLWLNHGELSGLTALLISALLTVLCLGLAPAWLETDDRPSPVPAAVLSLAYLATLIGAVALGFTRAEHLKEMVWADLPLLCGGILSLGTLASALFSLAPGAERWALAPGLILSWVVFALVSHSLIQSWKPAEAAILGVFGVGMLLTVRQEAAENEQGTTAGVTLLLLLAVAMAFVLGAGYGIGLMAMGGWMVAAWPLTLDVRHESRPTTGSYALVFLALLLLHRLLLLQSGNGVDAFGPASTWDLLAIVLGVVLPLSPARSDPTLRSPRDARYDVDRPATVGPSPSESPRASQLSRFTPLARVVEWIVVMAGAPLLVAYLLGGRSVAGLVLGLALVQLLAPLFRRGDSGTLALSSLVSATALLIGAAWVHGLPEPTHHRRVLIVLFLGALIWLRSAAPAAAALRRARRSELR